ncbi:MAG: hypothetical protein JW776_16105 [Candidatus Lokiarchaeota archaeon]|nr:hypothetical protein [Candidatus Lokiarchaeota archaeon]
MIYSIILVDADSGILLLEKKLKIQKENNVPADALANFFGELNNMIDDIQKSMKKGQDLTQKTRVVASENSSITLHFQPNARILICAISDPDDDTEKITNNLKIVGKRFWLKHKTDLEIFRKENLRDIFNPFGVDIETITLGGKIGEKFPKLLIAEPALERIKMMGIINHNEYNVANMCDGKTSAFKIAKNLNISSDEAKKILNKLDELDVVKVP